MSGVLDGKVVLITGAGSPVGLGRAIALAMAAEGARLAIMDVAAGPLVDNANEIASLAGAEAVHPIVGDVSDAAAAERAVEETLRHFGALHVLVNNAGITLGSAGFEAPRWPDFWEVPQEGWARVMEVNLNGPFFMARAAVRPMLEQGWGRIIGVTTSLHTMIRGHVSPYGPSKAGHEAFASAAAYELEGTGVTVNVLVPGGAVPTDLAGDRHTLTPEERERMIQPEVMGPPAVWLASDASSEHTGRRFVATDWDESLPLDERIERAGAPAAWPQLARTMPRGKRGA